MPNTHFLFKAEVDGRSLIRSLIQFGTEAHLRLSPITNEIFMWLVGPSSKNLLGIVVTRCYPNLAEYLYAKLDCLKRRIMCMDVGSDALHAFLRVIVGVSCSDRRAICTPGPRILKKLFGKKFGFCDDSTDVHWIRQLKSFSN